MTSNNRIRPPQHGTTPTVPVASEARKVEARKPKAAGESVATPPGRDFLEPAGARSEPTGAVAPQTAQDLKTLSTRLEADPVLGSMNRVRSAELSGLSADAFAVELEGERTALLAAATTPEQRATLNAAFDALAVAGGFYSPSTGRSVYRGTPSAELRLRVASEAIVHALPKEKLSLLVERLGAVGIATDVGSAREAVAQWNAAGPDLNTLISKITKTEPARAALLRHTNRALMAHVDSNGATVRRGGQPLADLLGLRLDGVTSAKLKARTVGQAVSPLDAAQAAQALVSAARVGGAAPADKADAHQYLRDLVKDSWKFFEDTVSQQTNFLPVDNIKKNGDGFDFDARTSTTNIGLYMLCIVTAQRLGLITKDDALARLRKTTEAVQKLPRFSTTLTDASGKERQVEQLYNWYSTSGRPRALGGFVSAVDNGNFVASVMAVIGAIKDADPKLAAELGQMTDKMDMGFFFDPKAGLLRHGADVKRGTAYHKKGAYNMVLTEARLAVLAGRLKNQIPDETWTNMKPKLGAEFAPGEIEIDADRPIQSWTDTVFEARLPSLYTEPAGTPLGAADEQVLQTHMNDTEAGVWGRSEAMADPIENGLYAAFGSTDAHSKEFSVDTRGANVFAPYASLMLSDLAPTEVVANLRNFEKLGVRGKYGMYESVALDKELRPMVTERFYSHHKGMEMLGVVKELDNFIPGLLHGSELNKGGVIERLLGTPVASYRQPAKAGEKAPVTQVQNAYEADASYDVKDVIGNGSLVSFASPVGSTLWMKPDYVLSGDDSFVLKDNATGKVLPFDQSAPSKVVEQDGARTFVYRVPAEGGELTVNVTVSMPSSKTKLTQISIDNQTGRPQDLSVTGYTRPMVDDPNAIRSHPGHRDLFVKTVLDEKSGSVIARRRTIPGDRQTSQPYFVFSIHGKDGGKFDWADGSRNSFIGRDGTVKDPAALKQGKDHQGQFGFTLEPAAALSKSLSVGAGATTDIAFVSGYTFDADEIPALVGREDGKRGKAAAAERAAPQFPPDSTHEVMLDFALQSARARRVRPVASVGEKLPLAELSEFTNGGRAHLIKKPLSLPRAWATVLAGGITADGIGQASFGDVSTVGGGGYAFGGNEKGTNAQRMRVTPWDPNQVTEVPLSGVVVKDTQSGETWSIAPNPATDPNGDYQVEVSPGYIKYKYEGQAGLRMELTKFVATKDSAEFWNIEVENKGKAPRELELQSFVKWALGEQSPRQDFETVAELDAERGAIFADNPGALVQGSVGFLAVLGEGTKGKKNDLFSVPEDPFSGLDSKIKVEPGKTSRVSFALGMATSRAEAERIVDKYKTVGDVTAELDTVMKGVNRYLDVLQVETPDESVNTMLNHWLPWQTLATHIQARSGHSQSGGGHGGRDQIQSWRNLLVRGDPMVNTAARSYLLEHASRQFPLGNMNHWWHSQDSLGQNSTISDTALWMPYALTEYVQKTGDKPLLDEQVAFMDGRPLNKGERDYVQKFAATEETASMYEHSKRAIDLTLDQRMGAHGLPLIMGGDWNDALNAVGPQMKGESAWLAFFLYDVVSKFSALAEEKGDTASAVKYREAAKSLKENIMTHLWDEERGYFIRGFADSGEKLAFNDVIVQGWAAESGAVDKAIAKKAVDSVFRDLYHPETNTIALMQADLGKEQWDGTVKDAPSWAGGAAEYPPDVRETGQYTHGVGFFVDGLAHLGEGDLLLKALKTTLPNVHAQREGYNAEPYALSADIQTQTGKAGWSHYSGAAGWVMRSAVRGMLGIDFRDGNKLFLDPTLPTTWDHYNATHQRGASAYRIEVKNPDHVSKGIRAVEVDGVKLDLARYLKDGIALVDDGKPHTIKVEMGTLKRSNA